MTNNEEARDAALKRRTTLHVGRGLPSLTGLWNQFRSLPTPEGVGCPLSSRGARVGRVHHRSAKKEQIPHFVRDDKPIGVRDAALKRRTALHMVACVGVCRP